MEIRGSEFKNELQLYIDHRTDPENKAVKRLKRKKDIFFEQVHEPKNEIEIKVILDHFKSKEIRKSKT